MSDDDIVIEEWRAERLGFVSEDTLLAPSFGLFLLAMVVEGGDDLGRCQLIVGERILIDTEAFTLRHDWQLERSRRELEMALKARPLEPSQDTLFNGASPTPDFINPGTLIRVRLPQGAKAYLSCVTRKLAPA